MTDSNAVASPSRPDSSEYPEYYGKYIAQIGDGDILQLLAEQPRRLETLRTLDDTAAAYRYAPDKWTVKEVAGHITDTERIFAYRLLRIARGDATPLPGFDQQPYVEAAHFGRFPMPKLVNAFALVRASTLALASELDGDAWRRIGTASGFPVSARALAYIIAGHTSHHLGILHDRYGLDTGV